MRSEDGQAQVVGTAFVVQGNGARNGGVRGTIASGIAAIADGAGRLGSTGFGTGTWVASGAEACRGGWRPERRR